MEKDKGKYICKKCNFTCNYKSIWNKHCDTVLHKTGKRKVRYDKSFNEKCAKCDYIAKNLTNMKAHYLNYHSTKKERKSGYKYYCDVCDFGVFAKKLFDNHLKTNKHNKKIKFEKTL